MDGANKTKRTVRESRKERVKCQRSSRGRKPEDREERAKL